MMDWKNFETKSFDPDCLKKTLENVRNQPEQMPTYVVCLEDWKKIAKLSDQEEISFYSAYLKLLNVKKIRPSFTV